MSLSHLHTQTFASSLGASEVRKRITDLTYLEPKNHRSAVRSRLLRSSLRWTGSIHGDTFYLFRFVGPNLLPPRFGIDLRLHLAESGDQTSVNLRVRPNRWLGLAAIWWTAVAVVMAIMLFTFVRLTVASIGITALFAVMAITQHIAINRACRQEIEFVARLFNP